MEKNYKRTKSSDPATPKKARRKRRRRSPRAISPAVSFTMALDAAHRRIAKAIEERAAAQNKLALLNAEIPALERTIAALGGQLKPLPAHPSLARELLPPLPLPAGVDAIGSSLESAPSKPLIPSNYREPNFSGMGSIPASAAQESSAPPAREPGEADFLPSMGKDWV